jgi:hypothetical protein
VRALLSWTHEGDLGRDLQQAAEVSTDERIGKKPAKEDVPSNGLERAFAGMCSNWPPAKDVKLGTSSLQIG